MLVLGATGRVGQLLRAVWLANPPPLRVLYQSRVPGPGHQSYDLGADPKIFGSVDAILSLWGVTSGDAAALELNQKLAQEARRIALHCGTQHVFHASSIAVYQPRATPLREDDRIAPPNPYGAAKWAMEQCITRHATADLGEGLHHCILRIGSIAGAESLAAAARSGTPPQLDRFTDGHSARRSFIAPSDLARVLEQLVALPQDSLPGRLNIGATSPITMDQLLAAAGIPFTWRAAPAGARQQAVLDCGLLETLVALDKLHATPGHIAQDWLRWCPLP